MRRGGNGTPVFQKKEEEKITPLRGNKGVQGNGIRTRKRNSGFGRGGFLANEIADGCGDETEGAIHQPDGGVAAGGVKADTAEPCGEKAANLVHEKGKAEEDGNALLAEELTADAGNGGNGCGAGEAEEEDIDADGKHGFWQSEEQQCHNSARTIERAKDVFHFQPCTEQPCQKCADHGRNAVNGESGGRIRGGKAIACNLGGQVVCD